MLSTNIATANCHDDGWNPAASSPSVAAATITMYDSTVGSMNFQPSDMSWS